MLTIHNGHQIRTDIVFSSLVLFCLDHVTAYLRLSLVKKERSELFKRVYAKTFFSFPKLARKYTHTLLSLSQSLNHSH